MENLQTILDRVLAGVGEMVRERKVCGTDTLAGMTYPPCGAPVTAGGVLSETRGPQSPSGDPATGEKVAGGKGGPGFKSPANAYTTDHTAPAGRGTSPKSTAGGKR